MHLVKAIETGTYRGDSTELLSRYFRQVATIELSEQLYERAKRRFEGNTHVTCYLGDSAKVLPLVLPDVDGPILYWLDGHWSGGITASESECPLLAEIDVINQSPFSDSSAILIDDARLFLGPPPPPHRPDAWPSFLDVFDRLRSVHARYVTLMGDIIVAVPPEHVRSVNSVWRQQMDRRVNRLASRRPY
jgi:hypothetical protein